MEYKVRCTTLSNFDHNIMILAGQPVNISEFSEPVRLAKDPSKSILAGVNDDSGDEEISKKPTSFRQKKRTRVISGKDDNSIMQSSPDDIPWALEDYDGQHSYVSQAIDPDSRYVIFVNEGNEFRIIIVKKWFKFTPKLVYNPMSLREAEEHMSSRKKKEDSDRWMMRNRSLIEKDFIKNPKTKDKNYKVTRRLVNLEEEGLDFEDIVDDDDDGLIYDDIKDDESLGMSGVIHNIANKNLTSAGKYFKNIVKHLDHSNYLYEDDSDEESDETGEKLLSDYNNETNLKNVPPSLKASDHILSENLKPKNQSSDTNINSESKVSSKSEFSRGNFESPSKKRARSRSPSPKQPSTTVLSPSISVTSILSAESSALSSNAAPKISEPNMLITESDIIDILSKKPLTTKDLIASMKIKLRANPLNKERFRDIVRKVAIMKQFTSDEDKLLEIRPEYRK